MEVHHDGRLRREQRVEARFRKRMRVIDAEDHEVDNVDNADAQVLAEPFLEQFGASEHLDGQLEADADEDNVRTDAVVGRVLFPDRCSSSTVLVSFFDGQEHVALFARPGERCHSRRRLLTNGRFRSDDDLHQVLGAQAMIHAAHSRVRVRPVVASELILL